MQKTTLPSSQETEIIISVERAYREALVALQLGGIWSLILAKCCLAQWAIETYTIPINGALYIWMPTFIMGSLASAFYLHAHRTSLNWMPISNRISATLIVGLLVSLLFVIHAHWVLGAFSRAITAGLVACLLGAWSLSRASLHASWAPLAGALIWWGLAVTALRSPNIEAFFWLGMGFFIAQALPNWAMMRKLAKRRI